MFKTIAIAGAMALALALPTPAPAGEVGPGDSIQGPAVPLDGSRLAIVAEGGPIVIELKNLIAPDMAAFPWGPMARGLLDDILAELGNVVWCDVLTVHDQKRLVAICRPDGRRDLDLAELVIAAGLGVERRTDAVPLYQATETTARHAGLGFWTQAGSLAGSLPLLFK